MNKKIIKFGLEDSVYDINPPLPAKKYLPDWFKNASRFYDTTSESSIDHGKTFKVCMPFTDSLLSGYIFELWQDLEIIPGDIFPRIRWKDLGHVVVDSRDSRAAGGMTIPDGCWDIHFTLSHPLYIQTPPGYSLLITQPFNRFDLPFKVLTGIVDADKEPFFPGNYPMFLKSSVSGIIDAGTPMMQIIPFKRDSWKSEYNKDIVLSGQKASNKSGRKILGWYRDNVWSKKTYE